MTVLPFIPIGLRGVMVAPLLRAGHGTLNPAFWYVVNGTRRSGRQVRLADGAAPEADANPRSSAQEEAITAPTGSVHGNSEWV